MPFPTTYTYTHTHARTHKTPMYIIQTRKHVAQAWMYVMLAHTHTYAHTPTRTDLMMVNALSNPPVQHQSIPQSSADTAMLAGIRLGEWTTGMEVR